LQDDSGLRELRGDEGGEFEEEARLKSHGQHGQWGQRQVGGGGRGGEPKE